MEVGKHENVADRGGKNQCKIRKKEEEEEVISFQSAGKTEILKYTEYIL